MRRSWNDDDAKNNETAGPGSTRLRIFAIIFSIILTTMNSTEIIIFYKYTRVSDVPGFVDWQKKTCEELNILGRILIAEEGINGTVEGSVAAIAEYERRMHALDGSVGMFGDFSDVWFKHSPGTGRAFRKLRVRIRQEIVGTGLSKESDIDPNVITGKHISAEELKGWIESGEEFEIIDMRNDYEYAVGHFAGSHDSKMNNFRDLQSAALDFEHLKTKKVLTVCTYGVRCEKASGFLKQNGFEDVYQLHGGIGTYMKQYPGQDFVGSLYVFDQRMTEQFTDSYPVVGVCVNCGAASERFGNCAWDECHKQLIICADCAPKAREIWCGEGCRASMKCEVMTS